MCECGVTKKEKKMRQKIKAMNVCFVIILLVVIQGWGQSEETIPAKRLAEEMARFEKTTGGSIGVGAIHLESGRSFYNPEKRYPMASTYKVPIAVQLLSRIEKGEIQLSDMVQVEKTDLHPGSGTISRLFDDPGVILSLHNLMELMLLISDNSATDLCLKAAGGSAAVTQKMREIGIGDLEVSRPTFVAIANYLGVTSAKEDQPYSDEDVVKEMKQLTKEQRDQAAEAFSKDLQDTATPQAMAQLLQKIWNREILSEENSDFLLDIMQRCQTGKERIKGILPAQTKVYHKTGTISATTNDVGIIELPGDAGNVVTVIFIKDAEVDNDKSEEIIAQVARSLYDFFLYSTE
jgi:beta-lactamase class A